METSQEKPRDLPNNPRSLFVYFYREYPPAQSVLSTKLFMTTESVYERMRDIYKGHDFGVRDVEHFLKKAGYILSRMGNTDTDYRWLIKT